MTDLERLELILRRARACHADRNIMALLDFLINEVAKANDVTYDETKKQVLGNGN